MPDKKITENFSPSSGRRRKTVWISPGAQTLCVTVLLTSRYTNHHVANFCRHFCDRRGL